MCLPVSTPKFSIAQLIRNHASTLVDEGYRLSSHHWNVLNALKECRTGSLGHTVIECDHCGARHQFPLSCGNRHCPVCTGPKREAWREKQCEDLLPVPYFHLVFTLPHVLNPLIRDNRETLYNLLFDKAVEVLQQFAIQTYGGRLGITAILHTWGQAMGDHYHLHLIIPGGVLKFSEDKDAPSSPDWVPAKDTCLFPVRQLSLCFRAAFIKGLEDLYEAGVLEFHSSEMRERAEPGAFKHLLRLAVRRKWNVFCEKSHSDPRGAVNYLARYSHRVALDESRVSVLKEGLNEDEERLVLAYHDNRDGKDKTMLFSGEDFLKRYCLHILPPGFVRVRHYGFLANGKRQERLAQARVAIAEAGLGVMPIAKKKTPVSIETRPCPKCQVHALRWLWTVCVTAEGKWVVITPKGRSLGSNHRHAENTT